MRAVVASLLAAFALSGCGLQPLYGDVASSPVAATLRAVQVGPIEGRAGWLVRTKLIDRLGAAGDSTPAYRLDIVLDDNITAFGIRRDRAATRERRTLRARYQLVSLASGQVVLDATAGSDAGIDIVSSEYATVAAEQTALENLAEILADQVVARIGLYAARTGARR